MTNAARYFIRSPPDERGQHHATFRQNEPASPEVHSSPVPRTGRRTAPLHQRRASAHRTVDHFTGKRFYSSLRQPAISPSQRDGPLRSVTLGPIRQRLQWSCRLQRQRLGPSLNSQEKHHGVADGRKSEASS